MKPTILDKALQAKRNDVKLLQEWQPYDFDKIKDIGKDTDLWDRAGNSIVVDVPQAIFKELLKDYIIE